ncbi:MAG: phosphoenolpyruvate--protein phosphotransferase [Acidobacteria bacterium]|nr:phosphoenolpyruvate--protein phosphotransferase [Acidobacteriota bacterium]
METLKGVGVTSGIAIGQALLLLDEEMVVFREYIEENQVEPAVKSFIQAIATAKSQIQSIKTQMKGRIGEEHAFIFEAHGLILEDQSLKNETIKYIRTHQCNPDWAFSQVLYALIREFQGLEDSFFAERAKDLEDVGKRILKILTGNKERGFKNLKDDIIIVGSEFGPSNITTFDNPKVKGFTTDLGGPTTHTAIIAKALNLPAVLGLHTISRKVKSGDILILDGLQGNVIINPDAETIANYRKLAKTRKRKVSPYMGEVSLPAVTLDGQKLQLLANVELPSEVETALRNGAHGIGLYRTEFLFLQYSPSFPTEDNHYSTYCAIAKNARGLPVTIRTLDLGGEKFFHRAFIREKELNPVLGLRGVRLCLFRPDIFRVQLRGLLRACAEYPNIQIMFPLITQTEEFHTVKALLEEIRLELVGEGLKLDQLPKLGVMIEVPSAAMVADHLAQFVDFFSIGTNDLIQYFLAIDRANDDVNYLYQPFHPGFIRLLRTVIRSAKKAKIPVTCCGEMASHPLQASLLLSLGLENFSMNPTSIPDIHHFVCAVQAKSFRKLFRESKPITNGTVMRQKYLDLIRNQLSDNDYTRLIES